MFYDFFFFLRFKGSVNKNVENCCDVFQCVYSRYGTVSNLFGDKTPHPFIKGIINKLVCMCMCAI